MRPHATVIPDSVQGSDRPATDAQASGTVVEEATGTASRPFSLSPRAASRPRLCKNSISSKAIVLLEHWDCGSGKRVDRDDWLYNSITRRATLAAPRHHSLTLRRNSRYKDHPDPNAVRAEETKPRRSAEVMDK